MKVSRRAVVAVSAVAVFTSLALSAVAAPTINSNGSLLTYGYSNQRTQDAPAMARITGLSNSATWMTHLDGQVYGQPLLYGGSIYIATENDTLYALSPTTGHVRWSYHLGTAVHVSVIDQATGLGGGCGNINPLGITGTPVISPSLKEIFIAEETMIGATNWRNIRHNLVAISLTTHHVVWHKVIDPPGGNTSTYTIPALQQRPALTLANGRVYVSFGGLAGDCGTYHGYVVSVTTAGTGFLSYKVPTQTEGAIWATGGAVLAPNGDLLVTTGNGSSTTTFDGANAIIRLSPILHVVSEWAPPNWATLSAQDWDLGSAGVVYVPGTSLLFVAGKPDSGSHGYLVDANALGSGPGPSLYTGDVCTDPSEGVFGADATAMVTVNSVPTPFVFAACRSGTVALSVTTGLTPSFTRVWGPTTASPGGSPVVAGGLVWALDWNNHQLVAMAPRTGAVVFTRSTQPLNHFATVTVGDGLVLVPTYYGVEAFATRP